MRTLLIAVAAAGLFGAAVLPAAAQSSPPPLPSLTPEQSTNLDRELARYRQEIDDRVARGELPPEDAQRLIDWRRWQLARQIAGLNPPEAPPMVAQREYGPPREYVAPPPYYDPWYRPYPYYAPAPAPYYYGPRVSVCAGGFGHHSFGSVCF